MARTSVTHPLRIDTLPVGNGSLGITFCPGKKGDSAHGAPWARDLDLDMDSIEVWGAAAVVTLIEDHEFEMLSVRPLGEAVMARGIEWHHLPVRDLNYPTPETMACWQTLSPQLHQILECGGKVLVHCRGGLGRAGTLAALILIERGRTASDAIQEVRSVRRGAVETVEQERWLECHAQGLCVILHSIVSIRINLGVSGAIPGISCTGFGCGNPRWCTGSLLMIRFGGPHDGHGKVCPGVCKVACACIPAGPGSAL